MQLNREHKIYAHCMASQMISTRQFSNSLYGIWLILKFDIQAWRYFDASLQGFWSSFVIAFLLAPFHLVHAITDFGPDSTGLPLIPYLMVEMLSYVVAWTLFPFAMLYISSFLDRAPRYFFHMVPYNWLRLPIEGPIYIVILLSDFGLMSVEGAAFLNLLGLAALIIYSTFVAGVGLKITTGTAMSLVALDIVLSLITASLIDRI